MSPSDSDKKEVGKERIGLISGSILGWGLVLLAVRPRSTQFVTGASLRFNFQISDIYDGPLINPKPIMFLILNVIVALGVAIVTLAVFHLVAHGLQIAPAPRLTPGRRRLLVSVADFTYHGVILATQFAAIYLLLVLPSYPFILLQHWLVVHLGFGPVASTALAFTPAGFVGGFLGLRYLRSFLSRGNLSIWRIGRGLAILLLLYCSYVLVAETTYTVSISTGKTLYSKAVDRYIEALIRLGGATSAASAVTVEVLDERGNLILRPQIAKVDGGAYHCYFSIQPLAMGRYQVRLRYARTSLTGDFPFIQPKIERSVFVAVTQ